MDGLAVVITRVFGDLSLEVTAPQIEGVAAIAVCE
jgi:hypothetical protein